jgi:hypothetical protein
MTQKGWVREMRKAIYAAIQEGRKNKSILCPVSGVPGARLKDISYVKKLMKTSEGRKHLE